MPSRSVFARAAEAAGPARSTCAGACSTRLLVADRAREQRGLLLERDRHGRGHERQAEGVEDGDERLELRPSVRMRERDVERVLAERLEVRVVERRRERVRHDAAQESRKARDTSRARGRRRRCRRGRGRGAAPAPSRARERARRTRAPRRDTARGRASRSRPPPCRTPRSARPGARPGARGGGGRRRSRSRVATIFTKRAGGREHPGDEARRDRPARLRVMKRRDFLRRRNAGEAAVPPSRRNSTSAKSKPAARAPSKKIPLLLFAPPKRAALGFRTHRRDQFSSLEARAQRAERRRLRHRVEAQLHRRRSEAGSATAARASSASAFEAGAKEATRSVFSAVRTKTKTPSGPEGFGWSSLITRAPPDLDGPAARSAAGSAVMHVPVARDEIMTGE